MADGDHSYGQELQDEGAGTFLHPASGMLLARCRAFVGDLPEASLIPSCTFTFLRASNYLNRLILDGVVETKPAAFGVIAYNDPSSQDGDYDATGWTGQVNTAGRFHVEV